MKRTKEGDVNEVLGVREGRRHDAFLSVSFSRKDHVTCQDFKNEILTGEFLETRNFLMGDQHLSGFQK